MPNIEDINGVLITDINAFSGVLKTAFLSINGVEAGEAGVPAPAAAYSVRLLDSDIGVTYTGDAMHVRRATSGTGDGDTCDVAFDTNLTPATISLDSAISNHSGTSPNNNATTLGQFLNVGTVNGTVYSDADSLGVGVVGSCFVETWYDQSGNSNDATQTTNGSQPQIHDGTVNADLIAENGKPALNPVSNGDHFEKSNTGVTAQYAFGVVKTTDTLNSIMLSSNNGSNIYVLAGVNGGTFGASDSGRVNNYYKDGSSYSPANADAVNDDTLAQRLYAIDMVGNAISNTIVGYPWSGSRCMYITQEIVIWNSDQSSNRTAIEENINSDYLIYQPDTTPTSGLLADYTGAAAAYSVRQLSDKAVISIRVRRDSDDEEQNIGFDANGQLDTTSLAAFVGSGNNGFVTRWFDQSTNGNHAEQDTDTSQPKIYDATTGVITENGKPAVQFDGIDDFIDIDNTAYDIGNLSSFFVANSNNGSAIGDMGLSLSGSVNNKRWYAPYIDGGLFKYGYGGSTTLLTTTADTNQHIFTAIAGTTLNGYAGFLDGTQVGTNQTRQTGLDTTQDTGIARLINLYYGEINVQELVIWQSDESNNRSGIEENINSDYLIYQPTDAPTSGLLADYTGAAAAYSVRQLSDKAVIALRIRRDSDDEETNIGFDSNGDLDTTAIEDFCDTANGYVTRWWDQSVNGNHADQPVGGTGSNGNQPQIYNGTGVITENGKPAVKFDGIDDSIELNSGITPANAVCQVLVTVFDNSVNASRMPLGSDVSSYYWQHRGTEQIRVATTGGNVSYNTGLAAGSQYLGIANGTGSEYTLRVNGTLGVTSTNSGNWSFKNIGRGFSGNTYAWDNVIQEVIFWPADQDTAGNINGIEENINSKYLIYQPTDQPTSGLLYDYGSATGGTDAAAAYSVRQLSDKAVMCMRIRRDMGTGNPGDDDETNIGFDSNGDLDTQAIADFCGTGTGWVTRWWDQSVNGNHADQDTDASQPQIYNGTAVITENSKPALKGGTLTAPSIAFNGTTSGYFIVNNQPSGQFVWLGTTVSNNHNIELERYGDIYWRSAAAVQTIATSAVTMGQQNLIYVMCNASKSDARINASDVTDTSAYPGSSSTISSLYNGRFGATVGNTVFQEIIYYASDQDSNATGIETDINDYFDIYT